MVQFFRIFTISEKPITFKQEDKNERIDGQVIM